MWLWTWKINCGARVLTIWSVKNINYIFSWACILVPTSWTETFNNFFPFQLKISVEIVFYKRLRVIMNFLPNFPTSLLKQIKFDNKLNVMFWHFLDNFSYAVYIYRNKKINSNFDMGPFHSLFFSAGVECNSIEEKNIFPLDYHLK
jgi:hypothetical protein